MYVTGSWSIVYALDAATGEELWRHDPGVPKAWATGSVASTTSRGRSARALCVQWRIREASADYRQARAKPAPSPRQARAKFRWGARFASRNGTIARKGLTTRHEAQLSSLRGVDFSGIGLDRDE